jgi:hypothetical protein
MTLSAVLSKLTANGYFSAYLLAHSTPSQVSIFVGTDQAARPVVGRRQIFRPLFTEETQRWDDLTSIVCYLAAADIPSLWRVQVSDPRCTTGGPRESRSK